MSYFETHGQIITARKRSLGQGNIFTPVCHSVHRGCAWLLQGGACVVVPGGGWGLVGVWFFPGGMCSFFWGACMVFSRGHAWFFLGGHAWFFLAGGMHVFFRGACMVFSRDRGHAWFFGGGACIGYNQIRSMSGRYASYLNAFLIFFVIWA